MDNFAREREFKRHLENLRSESYAAAHYVYSDMAVNYAASKCKPILKQLNVNSRFWIAHRSASQTAAYVCLSRVFDRSSRYNIHRLLDWLDANKDFFTRSALAARRKEAKILNDEGDGLIPAQATNLTAEDMSRLRKAVAQRHALYQSAIQPARHQHIAHRVKVDTQDVKKLYSSGKVSDLWRLTTFLHAFHEALWQLYENGRPPRLQRHRYSVGRIFNSPSSSSAPHEAIVRDTRNLLERLIT